MSKTDKLVLVTGGTGFIATHVVKAFLDAGYRVRTTCRDPENRKKAAALFALQAQLDDQSRLEIVLADDLLEPECWKAAAHGCQLCAHLASPFYIAKNKSDEVRS
jgi:nucleoside-diphosphate-sugar epimerase